MKHLKDFKVTISFSTTVRAEDSDEAINKLFDDIENEPQQTLGTFISEHTVAKEISYDKNGNRY